MLDALIKGIPVQLTTDKGTETGLMQSIQIALRYVVQYEPSIEQTLKTNATVRISFLSWTSTNAHQSWPSKAYITQPLKVSGVGFVRK